MDWIKKGIETIVGAFETILDWLNPKSDNFIFIKIIRMIEEVFVPSPTLLDELFEQVNEKLAFVDTINSVITSIKETISGLRPAPSLSINIGETKYNEGRKVKIIDLSWYEPFKPLGDIILTGFIYVKFIWSLFIHLPSTLSAAGGSIEPGINIINKGGK